jgi:metal-responsive CopG/Arc/MetJ family transcriptional regulator
MKTAISVPDGVFDEAEQLALQTGRSRSEIYSTALGEYLARHSSDQVTEAVNEAVDAIGDEHDGFASAVARTTFSGVEW